MTSHEQRFWPKATENLAKEDMRRKQTKTWLHKCGNCKWTTPGEETDQPEGKCPQCGATTILYFKLNP